MNISEGAIPHTCSHFSRQQDSSSGKGGDLPWGLLLFDYGRAKMPFTRKHDSFITIDQQIERQELTVHVYLDTSVSSTWGQEGSTDDQSRAGR